MSLVQLACPDAVYLLDPIKLMSTAKVELKSFVEELFGTEKVLKLGVYS